MRYQVIKGSESGHCCFEATVVDTHKPHTCYEGRYEWVCECFDLQQANKIADALNTVDAAPIDLGDLIDEAVRQAEENSLDNLKP